MRNRNMRGGYTLEKDDLEEILGDSFIALMDKLEEAKSDHTVLSYGKNPDHTKPAGASDDDISHVYVGHSISAAELMKKLEGDIAPYSESGADPGAMEQKRKELSQFYNVTNHKRNDLRYPRFSELTYRTKYHYLFNIVNQATAKVNDKIYPHQKLTDDVSRQVVTYLYDFIAHLDQDKTDASSIVDSMYDNPVFRSMTDKLEDLSISEDNVYEALVELAKIILQIQRKYAKDKTYSDIFYGKPDGTDWPAFPNKHADIKNAHRDAIKSKLKGANGTIVDDAYTGIKGLSALVVTADFITATMSSFEDAAAGYNNIDKAKKFIRDVLRNTGFLPSGAPDNTGLENIADKIDETMTGGGKTKSKIPPGGTVGVPTLPILYGMKDDKNITSIMTSSQVKNDNLDSAVGANVVEPGLLAKSGGDNKLVKIQEAIGKACVKIAELYEAGDVNAAHYMAVMLSVVIDGIIDIADNYDAIQNAVAGGSTMENATKAHYDAYLAKRSQELKDTRANMLEEANVIAKLLSVDISNLREDFLKLLIKAYSKVTVASGASAPISKKDLSDNTIWEFYKNYIASLSRYKTYNKVLALLKDGSPVEIRSALSAADADKAKYRINVKKGDRAYIDLTQYGGANGITVFASFFPSLTTGISIWLDSTRKITVRGTDLDIMTSIVDRTLLSSGTFTISGIPITPATYVAELVTVPTPYDGTKSSTYVNALLKAAGDSDVIPGWKGIESKITKKMLRTVADASKREYDNRGICPIMQPTEGKCLNIIRKCAQAAAGDRCKILIENDFSTIVSMGADEIKKHIVKVDPKIAYVILKSLCFSWYEHSADSGVLKGLKYYKVQSVGSWISELQRDTNLSQCLDATITRSPSCSIRACLGKDNAETILRFSTDESRKGLFLFLDLMVQWLNAHPEILNQELSLHAQNGQSSSSVYPDADKKFKIYSHVDPYDRALGSVNKIICQTMRVRDELSNGLSNFDLMQGFFNTRDALSMPLNRYVVGSPFPNYSSQFGGDVFYDSLDSLQGTFTSATLQHIYNDLKNTMKRYGGAKPSSNTDNKINIAIKSIEDKESELRKELRELAQKIQLYKMSNGRINVIDKDVSQHDLKTIMEKHSYLTNKNKSYSRKAINVVDALHVMAKALMGKMETQQTNTYNGPINRGYHLKKH